MGVQYDSKLYFAGENIELNMVWESAVERNDLGWQCEMSIIFRFYWIPTMTNKMVLTLELAAWAFNMTLNCISLVKTLN